MTKSTPPNPYKSSAAEHVLGNTGARPSRWPKRLVQCFGIYYIASALTLPFVNAVWIGEVPILAAFQVPKSLLKSVVHELLMFALRAMGMSNGSFSPDYIATHGWAMAIMVTTPALLMIAVLLFAQRTTQRRNLFLVLVACATLDAVTTLWFDHVSSLKLYNASYF